MQDKKMKKLVLFIVLIFGTVCWATDIPPDSNYVWHAAEDNYHFTEWSGDMVGSENPKVLTMTDDKSAVANFALDEQPPPETGVRVKVR